jgi:hypothetical protein
MKASENFSTTKAARSSFFALNQFFHSRVFIHLPKAKTSQSQWLPRSKGSSIVCPSLRSLPEGVSPQALTSPWNLPDPHDRCS